LNFGSDIKKNPLSSQLNEKINLFGQEREDEGETF
jgi:hypothetical protein